MRHHFAVLEIELTEFKQVVGERLALCKMLLKATKTTVHRMTPGVDDFGVRKNGLDKPHVGKIIGHLVREKRRILSMSPGLVDVLLTERPQGTWRNIGQALGKHLTGARLGQALRNKRNVREFAGAIHLGMTGKDLLQ